MSVCAASSLRVFGINEKSLPAQNTRHPAILISAFSAPAKTPQNCMAEFDLEAALRLIDDYRWLVDHWSTHYFGKYDELVERMKPCEEKERLVEFYRQCHRNNLARTPSAAAFFEMPCRTNDGMSPKKRLEVYTLLPLLHRLRTVNLLEVMVDVGAGRCYMPIAYLQSLPRLKDSGADSVSCGLKKIVCLEDGLSICEGKWQPDKLVARLPNAISSRLHICTVKVDAATVLSRDVFEEDERYLMYSVHACGELAVNMLRMFIRDKRARVLCCIGCCYHFLDNLLSPESLARSEGQWSRDVFALANMNEMSVTEECIEKLYRRALLEILPREEGDAKNTASVYADARSKGLRESFAEYCRRVHAQGLAETDEELQLLHENNVHHRDFIKRLWHMRCSLGPVAESIILWDRLLFLRQQLPKGSSVEIVPAWDASVSPRNLAIIAIKPD